MATDDTSLREIFDSYDTNHDNRIDPTEFLEILKSNTNLRNLKNSGNFSQPTQAEVNLIFENSGYQKTNGMTFENFKVIIEQSNQVDAELREKFAFFDTDGNGKIDRKELKSGLKKLNQDCRSKVVKKMIEAADIDGDGQIDFEEFRSILGEGLCR